MKRDQVLGILSANRERFREFHVRSLSIFGSVARDEATEASDVDVLVEFEPGKTITLFLMIRLQILLEEILGRPVDLGTPDSLREEFREQALREAIRAA